MRPRGLQAALCVYTLIGLKAFRPLCVYIHSCIPAYPLFLAAPVRNPKLQHTSAHVSTRQHTSEYIFAAPVRSP